ncbi:hypothetical protein BGP_6479 [Beggiatoa sp. PS]|nr:hypothetical protein BGP_6479 [Beggiatoa sp. PS]
MVSKLGSGSMSMDSDKSSGSSAAGNSTSPSANPSRPSSLMSIFSGKKGATSSGDTSGFRLAQILTMSPAGTFSDSSGAIVFRMSIPIAKIISIDSPPTLVAFIPEMASSEIKLKCSSVKPPMALWLIDAI